MEENEDSRKQNGEVPPKYRKDIRGDLTMEKYCLAMRNMMGR